ncbi:hypothetical protein RB623_24750 [Mesorhizobium sp. LHD-90]|uniref:hypothetical protein n=1 Tax=Mesorhizobium sp. LHD-90 TaxID=3071414 RepID=UPI0027DEEE75|nr:hypothetical protein [Mesorhizobium sp. LHD-90]MDQ6437274.1 hypothetical protein [Mesorhizobium sp. LHD-90]
MTVDNPTPCKAAYLAEIERMRQVDGIDGVIMGCTEIIMLIGQADFHMPVFDTTRGRGFRAILTASGLSFRKPFMGVHRSCRWQADL